MKIYRYRAIKSALRELDDGAFYFAEPNELNDPIEGYLKIFWRGDVPAWEGLLKNFLCSLFYNLQTYLLMSNRYQNAAQENFLSDLSNKTLLFNLFDKSRRCVKFLKSLTKNFWRRKLCGKSSNSTATIKLNSKTTKWNLFSER